MTRHILFAKDSIAGMYVKLARVPEFCTYSFINSRADSKQILEHFAKNFEALAAFKFFLTGFMQVS